MAKDPKYVRLTPRLTEGIISDTMASGWSIAGMDVKPFPEARRVEACKFVRRQLNAGHLEPCSRAEYEQILAEAEALSPNDAHVQEGRFQRDAAEAADRVEQTRVEHMDTLGDPEDDDEDEDGSTEVPDEDPDEDEEEEEAPKAKPAKKAAAKKKS